MTELQKAKIDLALCGLRLRQMAGDAPPPGQISPEYIAKLSTESGHPIHASSIRRVEKAALAKLRHALTPITDDSRR